jgi:hypothetical protein
VRAVRAALARVAGVNSVESEDAEGEDTAGFVVRARGAADPRPGLFQAAVDGGFVLLDMHRERASLEETFRSLTRDGGGGGRG